MLVALLGLLLNKSTFVTSTRRKESGGLATQERVTLLHIASVLLALSLGMLLLEDGGPLLELGHLGLVLGRVVAVEALGAALAVPVGAGARLVAGHLRALALASAPHQLGERVRPRAVALVGARLAIEQVMAEKGVGAARGLRGDEVGLALATRVWNGERTNMIKYGFSEKC